KGAATGGGLQAVITTSELVVGQNRLAFGLLKAHQPLDQADVVVRLYDLHGQQGQLTAQTMASYARLEIVEQGQRVHMHPDGTRHVHNEVTDVHGIYVTQINFERSGLWGFEVLARQGDGPVEVARFTVNVLEAPRTPMPGTPAPRSHNLIASDVQDIQQIDTSAPPDPRLHQVRIADAIDQGKPQVIVFATPQFCTSRICGPVVDVVRTLLPAYSEQVVFTHQEIWQDAAAHAFFPTVVEWGLQTEPWIFIVDGQGIIRARFEGLTTAREIEAVLQQVLAQGF
ncbi:MAG TPA: thioredoxin family protein, partial [Candidatus Tectomicrobia bacterium]